jgi:uncharacterized membrane protein
MDLGGRLRGSFLAGVLLVAPLAVTAFVLGFVFDRLTGALAPLVRATRLAAYTGNSQLLAQLLTALLLAGGITALGYFASWSVGRRLFGGLERGVRLVPLVRTVYFGVRGISESLLERAAGYESVVVVEYPREGVYVIGFVTNESPRATRAAVDDDALLSVFVPNSPNPTGGRLLLVPPDELHEVDMSVRRGLRLLITTGLSVDHVTDELPNGDDGDEDEGGSSPRDDGRGVDAGAGARTD